MATTSLPGFDQKKLRERLSLWDSQTDPKAPLSTLQKDVLIELTNFSNDRPLPSNLPVDDGPATVLPPVFNTDSKSSESNPVQKFLAGTDAENGGKIENSQQFFSWFSEVENEIEKEEDLPYRCHIEELESFRAQCDGVLDEVSSGLEYLMNLQQQYINVSTKTNALHEACEHLLAEQTRLMNTAESISNKLSYFNELDSISSKLGSPQLTVTNESFVPMLSRLDECILYIKSNPQYKESDVFLARFRQCLSRALNLMKTHVMNILQAATLHVKNAKETGAEKNNAFTLFYGKFRANAPRVKSLMEQLEMRTDKSPEYEQILSDCHQCYFSQRETLLGPSINSTINDLATKHVRDHCSLMRSGCAFMVHVCEDEYQLYLNFFSKPTIMLDEMLERLCSALYDVFRPLIIHINHLETLAELCSILKLEMIEEHVEQNPQELRAFENVIKQLLMDVQERLVYRTYIYIRTDILQYSAAQGDLAYPEKLEMMESIAEGIKKGQIKGHSRTPSNASSTSAEVARLTGAVDPDSVSLENVPLQEDPATGWQDVSAGPGGNLTTSMPMSPADLHGMWYPTVRRTLVTLSKLYRCIDKTTFQGLSQEALQSCIQSLINAKEGITKRKAILDGQLFMIKHLLILREQIAPFQADFSIRETSLDFSKFKDAAYGLLHKRSQIFSFSSTNSLLQFIAEGTPQVMENFVDSKRDVDGQLKRTCEEFIHSVSDMMTEPLKSFLSRASIIINIGHDDNLKQVSLRTQPFAAPEKLHDVVAETYKLVKKSVPNVHRSMALYLANRETEIILFKPIKVNVQQRFQKLNEILTEHFTEEDRQIVACPRSEQINLLLVSSKT
ncbi:conserved oligomeric Golgi complex subunit 3-like isoform X2 [Ruditapes philippinarum]|uniref:conserved oligomeric Golgi complex subunit 3-like isoform X2 n=1 Tax=Ruditapes philippinarum TaxID=129788 RepID=UPI00295B5F3D|nr:conserved oligomeric Golgi complex subunit 3-like isoform X2 [Ruditapes philippinarum]